MDDESGESMEPTTTSLRQASSIGSQHDATSTWRLAAGDCGQCYAVRVRRKLNTDLSVYYRSLL